MKLSESNALCCRLVWFTLLVSILLAEMALSIRFPDRISQVPIDPPKQPLKSAVFALGSFWRSEAVFGCLDGVVRTTVGYAGGSKANPEYRSLGDHAESVQGMPKIPASRSGAHSLPLKHNQIGQTDIVQKSARIQDSFKNTKSSANKAKAGSDSSSLSAKSPLQHPRRNMIEYDPKLVNFRQLLEVFWSSHDSRQVFGQGPDVGSQYRSIIFTNGSEESRLAAVSKEREQTKSKSSIVTTQIQQLGTFYPAEPEHQKFELKRNPFLLQLIGNLPEVELESSSLAAKLNSYSAELCPTKIQKQIDAKIDNIIKKGWPILREL